MLSAVSETEPLLAGGRTNPVKNVVPALNLDQERSLDTRTSLIENPSLHIGRKARCHTFKNTS
jgi:hypothetical protein